MGANAISGHFAEARTGIDLRVSATLHHVDFAREEVDLAVRHGDGNWPGLDTVRLSAEQLFAVCSPKLLSGRRLDDLRSGERVDIDSRKRDPLDFVLWKEAKEEEALRKELEGASKRIIAKGEPEAEKALRHIEQAIRTQILDTPRAAARKSAAA